MSAELQRRVEIAPRDILDLARYCRRQRSNCLIFLRNDPRLEPIRKDPRYQVLLHRVGLDDVAIASYKK